MLSKSFENKQCIPFDSSCGKDKACINKWHKFCPVTDQCQSISLPCGEECDGLQRYCPRHRFDIRDGKDSCIENDRPCGDQCPEGKYFCLATYSCDSSPHACPCHPNKWPAKSIIGLEKCELFANETIPRIGLASYHICFSKDCGSNREVRGGDCHPDYVYCQETKKCLPLLGPS